MTGYLTQRGYIGNGYYRLAVPNREICNIIIERVLTLFRKEVAQNGKLLEDFCNAIVSSNEAAVEQLLTEYMEKTISIRDNFARSLHENKITETSKFFLAIRSAIAILFRIFISPFLPFQKEFLPDDFSLQQKLALPSPQEAHCKNRLLQSISFSTHHLPPSARCFFAYSN